MFRNEIPSISNPEGGPFRGERELIRPEKSRRVSHIPDKPGWVIRESNIKPFIDPDTEKYSLERWRHVFHMLKNDYGIAVPETEAVVGDDGNGRERMYLLTREVEGIALDEAELLPAEAARDIEELFTNFARYLVDQFKAGDEYYSDFKPEQFMYGRTARDSKDKVYLVDLDLFSSRYDREQEMGRRPEYRLAVELKFLLEHLDGLTEKFYPKQGFDSARSQIEQYISEVENQKT